MDNLVYVFAAFAVVWLLVLAYLLALAQRQRALAQEIGALEAEWRQMKENRP